MWLLRVSKTLTSAICRLSALVCVIVVATGPSRSAFAASGKSPLSLISVSGGISSPSAITSLAENPACLAKNYMTTVYGAVHSSDDQFDPLAYLAGLFMGNGTLGAGVAYTRSTATGSGSGSLEGGLAAEIKSLKTIFGISTTYGLDGGSMGGVTAGLLTEISSKARMGFVVYDLTHSISAFGAGLAFPLSPQAELVVDAGADGHFRGVSLKPGLKIGLKQFLFAYSYGFSPTTQSGGVFTTGHTVGVVIALGKSFHIDGYYNEYSKYSVGVGLSF